MSRHTKKWIVSPILKIALAIVVLVVGIMVFRRLTGHSTIRVLNDIRDQGTLKIGVDSDFPPLNATDANGNAVGFETDLAKRIGTKVLGSEGGVVIVPLSRKLTMSALNQEDVSFLIAGVAVTESNQENYQLTDPYYQEDIRLLTLSGKSVSLDQDQEITIGVFTPSTARTTLQQILDENQWESVQLQEVASYEDARAFLEKGQIDAFCAEMSVLDEVKTDAMQVSDQAIGTIQYAIAVRNRENDLFRAVQDAYEELKESGELASLYQKYNLTPPPEE